MAYNETYFVLWGLRPFWLSDLEQSNEYSIKEGLDGGGSGIHYSLKF